MPVVTQDDVAKTFGSLVATCCLLFNTNSKMPIFHPNWTMGRHHGVEDAFFIIHLH